MNSRVKKCSATSEPNKTKIISALSCLLIYVIPISMRTRWSSFLIGYFFVFYFHITNAQALDLNGKWCFRAILATTLAGLAMEVGPKLGLVGAHYSGNNFMFCKPCDRPDLHGIKGYLHGSFHRPMALAFVDLYMKHSKEEDIRGAEQNLAQLDFVHDYLWKIVSRRYPNIPRPVHRYSSARNSFQMDQADREFGNLLAKLETMLAVESDESDQKHWNRVLDVLFEDIDVDSPEMIRYRAGNTETDLLRLSSGKTNLPPQPTQIYPALVDYGRVMGKLPK